MGRPTENILDVYGTDAAVRCPACAEVYVVSRLINRKNGRKCPHCMGSLTTFKDKKYSVEVIVHVPPQNG